MIRDYFDAVQFLILLLDAIMHRLIEKLSTSRQPSAWQHSANIPSNGNEEWRKRINYVCFGYASMYAVRGRREPKDERRQKKCDKRRMKQYWSEGAGQVYLASSNFVPCSCTTWIGFHLPLSPLSYFFLYLHRMPALQACDGRIDVFFLLSL